MMQDDDWVFASPFMAGEMPYRRDGVGKRYLIPAAEAVGLKGIGWHTLRHTYRSWLDVAGTPIGGMKDLMRHSDIRTTMNVYGSALPEPMREANGKVVRMALRA
jgi:integrase